MVGKIVSWNKGLKTPIEVRKKISKSLSDRKLSDEHKNNISKGNKGKTLGNKFSQERKIKISLGRTNETEFTGFKESENRRIRKSPDYKLWRESVFKRDNYICRNNNCQHCNNKRDVELHPHHIKLFSKYPENRFELENGITFCKDYHMNIHKKGD